MKMEMDSSSAAKKYVTPEMSIPWHLRRSNESDRSQNCWCLGSTYVLRRIEFAFRIVLFSCLPVAALIQAEGDLFLTPMLPTILAVAIAGETIGQFLAGAALGLLSFPLWLPAMTIVSALYVYNYTVAWWIVLCLLCLIFGIVAQGLTAQVSCLFTCLSMLAMLSPKGQDTDYPSRLAADALWGVLFAAGSCIVPPWRTSTKAAQDALEQLLEDIGICFLGLTESFWTADNIDRAASIARVKFIRSSMQESIVACQGHIFAAHYEQFGRTQELADMAARLELATDLLQALDSASQMSSIIEEDPSILNGTDKACAFADKMRPAFERVAAHNDVALSYISKRYDGAARELCANIRDELRDISAQTDSSVTTARDEVLYAEGAKFTPEPFFMPAATYRFHHKNFTLRVIRFLTEREERLQKGESQSCCASVSRILLWLIDPLFSGLSRLRRIVTVRDDAEVRIVKESFKTALAIALAVLFFRALEPNPFAISGPIILCFISSSDTSQAFFQGYQRLTGSLFGAILGYFAFSLATTRVQTVAGLCVVVLILSFFRTGQKFGVAAFFGSIVAVATIVPSATNDSVVDTLQQNTFAVIIYVAISVVVYPTNPTAMVGTQRRKTLELLKGSGDALMEVFCGLSNTAPADPTVGVVITETVKGERDESEPFGDISLKPSIEDRRRILQQCQAVLPTVAASLAAERMLIPAAEQEPSLRNRPFSGDINRRLLVAETNLAAIQKTMLQAFKVLLLESEDEQAALADYIAEVVEPARDLTSTMRELLSLVAVALADPTKRFTAEMAALCATAKVNADAFVAKQERIAARNQPSGTETGRAVFTPTDISCMYCLDFCVLRTVKELRELFIAAEAWQEYESRAYAA